MFKKTESLTKQKDKNDKTKYGNFYSSPKAEIVINESDNDDVFQSTKYDIFYSSSKAEVIINESDIDDVFQSIYTTVIISIQKSLGKGSDWIIDSVIDHTISISKYNSLSGSSYIKLPKELDYPRKGLINIQNIDDNECFKWCLAGYLNPAIITEQELQKLIKTLLKCLVLKAQIFQ